MAVPTGISNQGRVGDHSDSYRILESKLRQLNGSIELAPFQHTCALKILRMYAQNLLDSSIRAAGSLESARCCC
jgi:hypothetical protein